MKTLYIGWTAEPRPDWQTYMTFGPPANYKDPEVIARWLRENAPKKAAKAAEHVLAGRLLHVGFEAGPGGPHLPPEFAGRSVPVGETPVPLLLSPFLAADRFVGFGLAAFRRLLSAWLLDRVGCVNPGVAWLSGRVGPDGPPAVWDPMDAFPDSELPDVVRRFGFEMPPPDPASAARGLARLAREFDIRLGRAEG